MEYDFENYTTPGQDGIKNTEEKAPNVYDFENYTKPKAALSTSRQSDVDYESMTPMQLAMHKANLGDVDVLPTGLYMGIDISGDDEKETAVFKNREPGIYEAPELSTYQKGLRKVFGDPKLSEQAKAKSLIDLQAKEAGMGVYEYTQRPEVLEQTISKAVRGLTFGIPHAIQEWKYGEVDQEAESWQGEVGGGIGSLFGFFAGAAGVAGKMLKTPLKYIPQATAKSSISRRIATEVIKNSAILGLATTLSDTGEVINEPTFTEAAGKLGNDFKSGALTGMVFGMTKGILPGSDVTERIARIVTGGIGLNALRAVEMGGNPITDRPASQVIFDSILDVVFLWKGLPKSRFAVFSTHMIKNIDEAAVIRKFKDMQKLGPNEKTSEGLNDVIDENYKKINDLYNRTIEEIIARTEARRRTDGKKGEKAELDKQAEDAKVTEDSTDNPPKISKEFSDTVIYNGIQEGFGKYPAKYMFSDKKTGSTFTVDMESGEKLNTSIRDEVKRISEDFAEIEPIDKPTELGWEGTVEASVNSIKQGGMNTIYDARNLFALEIKNKVNITDEQVLDIINSTESDSFNTALREALKSKDPNKVSEIADEFIDTVVRENYPDKVSGEVNVESDDIKRSSYRDGSIDQTNKWTEIYDKKKDLIESDPEMFLGKIINDANRYLNGEKVSITDIKNMLEELVERGDELAPLFEDIGSHESYLDSVRDIDKWVDKIVGSNFKPISKKPTEIRFDVMIPLDKMPNAVVQIVKKSKSLMKGFMESSKSRDAFKAGDLIRNEEIFRATGYWFGKDGKWRYEVDDNKMKISMESLNQSKGIDFKLSDIVDYPELFEAVPGIKGTRIRLSTDYRDSSYYDPEYDLIEIGKDSKSSAIHEIQHAVNTKLEAFQGSSPIEQRDILIQNHAKTVLNSMRKVAKTKKIKNIIDMLDKPRDVNILVVRKRILAADIEKSDPEVYKIARKLEGLTSAERKDISEKAFENYRKVPGEMEARLTSERLDMDTETRKRISPWKTLDNMLSEEGLVTKTAETVTPEQWREMAESKPVGTYIPGEIDTYYKALKMGEYPELLYGLKTENPGTNLYTGLPINEMIGFIRKHLGKPFDKPIQEIPEVFSFKEDARDAIASRRGILNKHILKANKLINSINQKFNEIEREALTFVIEDTLVPKRLNRPDIEKIFNDEGKMKELRAEAARIKEHFEWSWEEMKNHLPEFSTSQIDNYITHLWDIPADKKIMVRNWFKTKSQFLNQRYIQTIKKGVDRYGLVPKTLDVSKIIKVHTIETAKAVANNDFLTSLKDMVDIDGGHLIQPLTEKTPEWYVEYNHPAIKNVIHKEGRTKGGRKLVKEEVVPTMVHPDMVRPLDSIFQGRFGGDFVNNYEALNGILKKSWLTFSLFHHGALFETGVAIMGIKKTAKIYFNPPRIYNALVKGEYDIFTKEAIAKDAVEVALVQVGETSDMPLARIQGYLDNIAHRTRNIPVLNKITEFNRSANSVWDKGLWNYLHDTLKLTAYEHLVTGIDPKLDIVKQKREIGQFINDTFGGQNWDMLMVKPKEIQMLTWALLSSDWTISTARQALAPTGIGTIYKESMGLRKSMGKSYWLRAGLYFGLGLQMLNAAMRKNDIKKNPKYYEGQEYNFMDYTMFGNSLGEKTYLFTGRYDDGRERYLRWGKQFRDFMELIVTPFTKMGSKISPIMQFLPEAMIGYSWSGFKNDDVAGTKGIEHAYSVFKTAVKTPIPFSIKKLVDEKKDFEFTDFFFPSSKGPGKYRIREYYIKAIKKGSERMMLETYESAIRNGLPAYILFGEALGDVNREIADNIAERTKSIGDLEDMRDNEINLRHKHILSKRISRLKMEQADFEHSASKFGSALAKFRHFQTTGSEDIPKGIFN